MQSTGHTATQARSFTLTQGSAIINAIRIHPILSVGSRSRGADGQVPPFAAQVSIGHYERAIRFLSRRAIPRCALLPHPAARGRWTEGGGTIHLAVFDKHFT